MATYKILQDIEAEDKLLGPLSLRQFIYAVIVVVLGFVGFKLGTVHPLLVIPFLPPLVFFALLAAPFGRDQSSEVWLLAKIKYFIFPRNRIWNQDGIQHLVTITAPKVVEKPAIKDFDKVEATSRLKALAATMDTRGWVVKNLNTPGYNAGGQQSADRLLDIQSAPQDDLVSVKPSEDVLDTTGTPLAQTMGTMQAQNQQVHRQAILQKMQTLAAQQKSAQTNLATLPATPPAPVASPLPVAPKTQAQPAVKAAPAPTPSPIQQAVTQTPAPAILKEVKSTPPPNELDVNVAPGNNGGQANEVVVSLH